MNGVQNMIFNGMMKSEVLFFNSEDDMHDQHFIEMERDCEEDIFTVRVCCDDEWEWKFYDKASNYELVKHAIFDIAFDSHNMIELINGLDEIFEDIFKEIVVFEHKDDCNCGGCCDHCTCK